MTKLKKKESVVIDIPLLFNRFSKVIISNLRERRRWGYLALTGNFERQFQDYFAFFLQQQLGSEYSVGREMAGIRLNGKTGEERKSCRADIAIIRNQHQKVKFCGVVELKAHYLHDASETTGRGRLKNCMREKYVPDIQRDLNRWAGYPNNFGIFLVTDIPYQEKRDGLRFISEMLPLTTAYQEKFKRELNRYNASKLKGNPAKWRNELLGTIEGSFQDNGLKVVSRCVIPLTYTLYKKVGFSLRGYLVKLKRKRMKT